jgi:hypothetical protein
MEDNNEYGNCWQDLVKRIDMENRVADATIRAWQMEEERVSEEDEVLMSVHDKKKKISGGGMKVGGKRARKGEGEQRSGLEKEKTGSEMHKEITERNEQRGTKKAKMEARKMVRKGKIRTLDSYFNRRSNDT